jgi:hypothetical protein
MVAFEGKNTGAVCNRHTINLNFIFMKKMSLNEMKSLSRNEMRQIMAGSDGGCNAGCSGQCAYMCPGYTLWLYASCVPSGGQCWCPHAC